MAVEPAKSDADVPYSDGLVSPNDTQADSNASTVFTCSIDMGYCILIVLFHIIS